MPLDLQKLRKDYSDKDIVDNFGSQLGVDVDRLRAEYQPKYKDSTDAIIAENIASQYDALMAKSAAQANPVKPGEGGAGIQFAPVNLSDTFSIQEMEAARAAKNPNTPDAANRQILKDTGFAAASADQLGDMKGRKAAANDKIKNAKKVFDAANAEAKKGEGIPVVADATASETVSDIAKMGLGGVWGGVGSILRGAGEALQTAGDYTTMPLINAITGNNDYSVNLLAPAAGYFEAIQASNKASVSAETAEAIKQSTPDGDLFDPSTWTLGKNPSLRGYAMLGMDVLGSMAPVVATAIGTSGLGATTSTISSGVVGGAQGGGAAAKTAAEAVDKLAGSYSGEDAALFESGNPNAVSDLEKTSLYYRQLLMSGIGKDEALRRTREAGEKWAFAMAAPIAGAGGAITSKVVNPASNILAGQGLAVRTAGRGGISGTEEGIQESLEGMAGKHGTNIGAGTNLDVTEGSFGDFALGSLGGTAMGATAGAMSERAPKKQKPAASPSREGMQASPGGINSPEELQASADAAAQKSREFATLADEARAMGNAELASQYETESQAAAAAAKQALDTLQAEHTGLQGIVNRTGITPPALIPEEAMRDDEELQPVIAQEGNIAQGEGPISPDLAIQPEATGTNLAAPITDNAATAPESVESTTPDRLDIPLTGDPTRDSFREWYYNNRSSLQSDLIEGGIYDGQEYARLPESLRSRSAHGMAKHLGDALENLRSLLTNGIDPNRGRNRGTLDTARLARSADGTAAGSGTGGGTAYSDGAFTLIAREGVGSITDINQVEAIVVNSALPQGVVDGLRAEFPNLKVGYARELGGLLSERVDAKPTSEQEMRKRMAYLRGAIAESSDNEFKATAKTELRELTNKINSLKNADPATVSPETVTAPVTAEASPIAFDLDATEDALIRERNLDEWVKQKDRTPLQRLIYDATVASVIDATNPETAEMFDSALENGRLDLAQYIAARARRAADSTPTTPGVSENNPKYATIKADLEARKAAAQAAVADIEKKLAERMGQQADAQPTTFDQEVKGTTPYTADTIETAEASPAAEKGKALTEDSVAAHRLETAKEEILRDIADGTLPDSVRSWSDLQDHVDANMYLNDADREDRMIGPLGNANGWGGSEFAGFTSKMVKAIDLWLANGRIGKPVFNPDSSLASILRTRAERRDLGRPSSDLVAQAFALGIDDADKYRSVGALRADMDRKRKELAQSSEQPAAAPKTGASPTGLHYPNRKLGLDVARTEDGGDPSAWANIALANLQPDDNVTVNGVTMTVKSIGAKAVTFTKPDGKTTRFDVDTPRMEQLVRDVAGLLEASHHSSHGKDWVSVLSRDPTFGRTGGVINLQDRGTEATASVDAMNLAARHARLDRAIDQLSDAEVHALYRKMGLAGELLNVDKKREALKQEHPDDTEAAMKAKPEAAKPEVNAEPRTEDRRRSDDAPASQVVLQNRNRSDAAYVQQMTQISANPDATRLGFSRDFSAGAPVILADGIPSSQMGRVDRAATGAGRQIEVQYAVVEADELLASNSADGTKVPGYDTGIAGKSRAVAGNGRVAGLKSAYQKGTAGKYREDIAGDEALHGVSASVIRGMKAPILVRIMSPADVTANIGDESNDSGVSQKSAIEHAKDDARRIDVAGLEFGEDGEVTKATMRQFVASMPVSEQTGMLTAGGEPTTQATNRLMGAIFWQAYQSEGLTELFSQATDPEARTVLQGLAIAAPAMARLKDIAGHDLDIRDLITEAAVATVNARRRNIRLSEYVNQLDLDASPEIAPILRMFAENIRSSKKIGESLQGAAEYAYDEATRDTSGGMFGDAVPAATRNQVLEKIHDSARQENLGQQGRTGADGGNAQGQAANTRAEGDRAEAEGSQQERLSAPDSRDFSLETQSEADLAAKESREQDEAAAAAAEAARQAEASSDTFGLSTGIATTSEQVRPAVRGQGLGLFDQRPTTRGERLQEGLIAIDGELDKALGELASALRDLAPPGQLNTLVDPVAMGRVLAVGMKASVLYLQKGAVKFAIWANNMIVGLEGAGIAPDVIKPYLKQLYLASKASVDKSIRSQMDGEDFVLDYDVSAIGSKSEEVQAPSQAAEPASIATGKWFGTRAKADEHIEKKRLSSTHEVVQVGQRFEIHEKPKQGEANGSAELGEGSQGALAGVPARESEAAAGQRPAGGGAARGSQADAQGNDRAGESGLQGARSLGDDTREVSVPEAGSADGRAAGSDGAEPVRGSADADESTVAVGGLTAAVPATQLGADFAITDSDEVGAGGAKTKFKNNIAAIVLLKELEKQGRPATREEQSILAKYVGWGGIPQAFARDGGAVTQGWERQVAELREVLTPDEYSAAAASTMNAHYTATEIVAGIWDAVQQFGFNGGAVLEPSVGTGNFFGKMPHGLRNASALVGVELDRITGGIAKLLYPAANIQSPMGFQDITVPDGHFDLAIGNPPFGSTQIHDGNNPAINRMSIHNYFFAKSVLGLKPNGVLAMVVTNRMMDAGADRARQFIADRTELLGAIRLPNDAFLKNAGTSVTTDIIFLRRLEEGEAATGESWTKVRDYTDKNGKTVPLNEYFHRNPDMMLGDFGAFGTMYREGDSALVARPGQDTMKLMQEAIKKLPRDFMPTVQRAPTREVIAPVGDIDSIRVGSMFMRGDEIHLRMEDELGQQRSKPVVAGSAKSVERIKGMIAIRDALTTVREMQLSETSSEAAIAKARAQLNKVYDAFVKANGPINQDANKRLFRDDPTWPQISALEEGFEKGVSAAAAKATGLKQQGPSAKKAAIFTKRTQAPYRAPESAVSAKDALVASLSELGRVDLAYMSKLYGKDESEIAAELSGMIFQNPVRGWETADEYLSGNVKQKLAIAEEAAKADPQFDKNVSALRDVQPADIEAVDISVKLGAHWVPTTDVAAFAKHITGDKNATAGYVSLLAKWTIDAKAASASIAAQWGTDRATIEEIITAAANQRTIQIKDKVSEDKYVVNEAATQAANEKVEAIKNEWTRWLWSDDARRERLARQYNDTFNADRQREYDGSHLAFPGKVGDDIIQLRPHQANAAWRIIQSASTLADHVVGAGKTFTLIAAAMEMRRMGRASKPMFVVPNHLVGQWAADFVKLYPGANVLAASKKDFDKENRKRMFARIATGDWDAVIVAHSSFGKIGAHPDFVAKFIRDQIADIEVSITATREAEGKSSRNVKQIEKQKAALEEKLKDLFAQKKKDDSLYFDELGIDALFLDEAHEFKNLQFSTSMTRIAGVPNSHSQKASDLFMKVQQVQQRTGGRNIVFATGTPISNSMAEMFTMQRYLDYKTMKDQGLAHFDAWARMYGEVVTDWELSPSGQYKMNSRFAKFVNMPELMQRYASFADVVNRDDINRMLEAQGKVLPVPKVKGGKPQNIIVERSAEQANYIGVASMDEYGNEKYPEDSLVWRAENLPKGAAAKERGADNMLKIMSDARKAALDMRLIDPDASDNPKSKVNEAADRMVATYHQWTADKGTQLVFIDLSTPKSAQGAEASRIRELIAKAEDGDPEAQEALDKLSPDELDALNAKFDVYNDLRDKLIARGIPAEEIAFIHSANTDAQKEELFGKVRSGRVRFLFGSTAKMGAGMNVQERLVALHHLDAPWRPSDLEQREGRIIRQGNVLYDRDPEGFEIEINRYATKQTLDSRMWQTIEAKARFIEQVRKGATGGREVEDIAGEAANAAEMKAASSGNPLILEEMELRQKLRKMNNEESEHDRQQHRVRAEIRSIKNGMEASERLLVDTLADSKLVPASFAITTKGRLIEKHKEVGAAILLAAAPSIMNMSARAEEVTVGEYGDFTIKVEKTASDKEKFSLWMETARGSYQVGTFSLDADPTGMAIRMANTVKQLPEKAAELEARIAAQKADLPKLEAQIKPWPKAADLAAAKARHAGIIEKLKPKKADPAQAAAAAEKDDDKLYSRSGSAWYYSPLTRAVEGLKQETALASQWRAMIEKAPGVKSDELEATGVIEWLQAAGGKVKKSDILDFLADKAVIVNDVMKGEKKFYPEGSLMHPATGEVQSREDWLSDLDPDYLMDEGLSEEEALGRLIDVAGDEVQGDDFSDTEYGKYTVPGGKNYRELLITRPTSDAKRQAKLDKINDEVNALPAYDQRTPEQQRRLEELVVEHDSVADAPRGDDYSSSHWTERNILVHVRFDERTDADGKKVLLIIEIQSDHGQEGKKKGFAPKDPSAPTDDEVRDFFDLRDGANPADYRDEMVELLAGRRVPDGRPLPRAPFVTKTDAWVSLAIKRMIRHAAENGFDRVAFINGQQAADLYDLSKQVDYIDYVRSAPGRFNVAVIGKNGDEVFSEDAIDEARVAEVLGKEIADKMVRGEGQSGGGRKTLRGLDLKVGGEGMRTFYDKIVPKVAQDVIKKLGGGKIGNVKFAGRLQVQEGRGGWMIYDTKTHSYYRGGDSGRPWIDYQQNAKVYITENTALKTIASLGGDAETQLGFDITPAMLDAALAGLPLFAKKNGKAGTTKADVEKVIAPVVGQWKNGPRIEVVQSVSDLPGGSAPHDVEGVYTNNNVVYLVADNLPTEERILEVLSHEAVGHAAMESMLGEDLMAELTREIGAWERRGSKLFVELGQAVDASQPNIKDQPTRRAKEIVALMAERGLHKQGSLWKKVTEAIKAWLRGQGFSGKWVASLPEDMVFQMLRDAERYLKNGNGGPGGPRGSRRNVQASLANSRRGTGEGEGILPSGEVTPGNPLFSRSSPSVVGDTYKLPPVRAFVTKIFDRFDRIKQVQKAVKEQGGSVTDLSDVYGQEEAYHSRAASAIDRFRRHRMGAIFKRMARAGVSLEDVGLYLYAQHASERNAQIATINPGMPDGGSGMTNKEAADILADFRQKGNANKLDTFARELRDITADTRQILRASGLESADAIDAWEKAYQFYVPLSGKDEANNANTVIVGRGFDVRGGQKRAMGRKDKAKHIIEQIIVQHEQAVIRAEKNAVGKRLLQFVKNNPDDKLWEVNPTDQRRYIAADGQVDYRNQPMRTDRNVVAVRINGQDTFILLADQAMADAIHNVGTEDVGFVLRALGAVSRFTSKMFTAFSPAFIAVNAVRDFMTAMLHGYQVGGVDYSMAIAKNIPRAVAELVRDAREGNSQMVKLYEQSGGRTGMAYMIKDFEEKHNEVMRQMAALQGVSLKEIQQAFAAGAKEGFKAVGRKARYNKFTGVFDAFVEAVETVNGIVENTTRLAAFKAAMDAGRPAREAGSIAKNLTVNFNRKGELAPHLGSLYIFFNASVQGTVRMGEALKDRRLQVVAAGMFMASALIAAMQMDDDDDEDGRADFEQIPAWQRSRNLIILGEGGDYYKIPLPLGWNVFHMLGTEAAVMLKSKSKEAYADGAGNMLKQAVGVFNPVGDFTPSVAAPFLQIARNESAFGGPIYPDYKKDQPDSQQFYDSTEGSAYERVTTWANEATGGNEFRAGLVDINPEKLEHVTEFFGGGALRFLTDTIDATTAAIDGGPAQPADKLPILRAFYGKLRDEYQTTRYYENKDKVVAIERELKGLQESGRYDEAAELMAEKPWVFGLSAMADGMDKQSKSIRELERLIRADDSLSDGERRARLQELRVLKGQALKPFNAAYEESVRK